MSTLKAIGFPRIVLGVVVASLFIPLIETVFILRLYDEDWGFGTLDKHIGAATLVVLVTLAVEGFCWMIFLIVLEFVGWISARAVTALAASMGLVVSLIAAAIMFFNDPPSHGSLTILLPVAGVALSACVGAIFCLAAGVPWHAAMKEAKPKRAE